MWEDEFGRSVDWPEWTARQAGMRAVADKGRMRAVRMAGLAARAAWDAGGHGAAHAAARPRCARQRGG